MNFYDQFTLISFKRCYLYISKPANKKELCLHVTAATKNKKKKKKLLASGGDS